MIRYFAESIPFPGIKRRVYSKWISEIIHSNNLKRGDINFIFCTDEYLLNINKRFLNHDYYTDIITFNYNEGTIVSSDIYISIDTVLKNSKIYSVDFEEELRRVMIHGILHLLGYDDQTKDQRITMRSMEDISLQIFTKKYSNN